MILTKHNLIHYLLDKDLIDMSKVIDGEFSVRNNDSRNSNLMVNKEYTHHNYFVKQIKATDQEKIDTIKTEAACYHLTSKKDNNSALKEFLPKFYFYDKRNFILITEQIKDVISLHEYYFGYYIFNKTVAEKLATILAMLHQKEVLQSIHTLPDSDKIKLRNQRPWVFTILDKPLQFWASQPASAEQQAMILILKNIDFCKLITDVIPLWQPNALLHNDLKFTNFLANINADTKEVNYIKLIDWELADYGDAAWDVACLMQSYLHLWATTDIPDNELQLQPNVQKITIAQIQNCIPFFWYSYVQQRNIPLTMQYPLLIKVIKFIALKLIHTCFETTPYSQTLQPNAVKLLQIAHNILKSPENAASHLLGIKY